MIQHNFLITKLKENFKYFTLVFIFSHSIATPIQLEILHLTPDSDHRYLKLIDYLYKSHYLQEHVHRNEIPRLAKCFAFDPYHEEASWQMKYVIDVNENLIARFHVCAHLNWVIFLKSAKFAGQCLISLTSVAPSVFQPKVAKRTL